MIRSINSPSNLERRYLCPGSMRLEKEILDKMEKEQILEPSDKDATRGVKLHKATQNTLEGKGVEVFDNDHDAQAVAYCVNMTRAEIDRAGPDAVVAYETQVDLTEYGIPPGEHGSRVDCLIIVPGVMVIVIDWKYGFDYVPAPKWNRQFKAYALGAYDMYGGANVRCVKLQPESQEEYQMTWTELNKEDIENIKLEIADIIANCEDPNAPLVRGKIQCHWCKAYDTCPAQRGLVLGIPKHVGIADHLKAISPVQRSTLYDDLLALSKWTEKAIASIETVSVDSTLVFADHEVAPGNKSRSWTNETVSLAMLKELADKTGKPRTVCQTEPKMLTVSQAEKLFGKKKEIKEYFNGHITENEGKLKLKRKKKVK